MIIEIEKEYQETIREIDEIVKLGGCRSDILYGDLYTVIAVEGDASQFQCERFETFPGVVRAWRVSSPYKTISKRVIGGPNQRIERERIRVEVKGPDGLTRLIGDGSYTFIAGPCSVEGYDQLARIGEDLCTLAEKYSIRDRLILRGGAFKPRTRPWDFRGLGMEALDYLDRVSQHTGLPYVTEVMSVDQVKEMEDRVPLFQIGARNYQNFNLLEAVGKTHKPILYKRGMASPLDEWLSAAEYIALQGNKDIVLCERGVRSTTHGDYNRTQIDFDVIKAVKDRTILPIIIDPSHSAGIATLVPFQFCAASAYQTHGTMVEVIADQTDRRTIKCDGKQGVRLSVYEKMIRYQLAHEKIEMEFQE